MGALFWVPMATMLYRVLDPDPRDRVPAIVSPVRRALFVAVAMVHIGVEYAVHAVRRFCPW